MPDAPKIVPLKPAPAPRRAAGSTTARGYGHAHRKLRAKLIAERPICQRCEADFSAHLHHLDRNPHNRHESNLELLCERCHRAEHGGR
jgi:5-methylcytosine-specific restriction endonuclease McrA